MSKVITIKLDTGMDTSITLRIDTDVMTQKIAKDVVDFWSGGDEVLEASDGDVFEAVARFAAPRLLHHLNDGWNENGAVAKLSQEEGWPSPTGISILDHELPDYDPVMFDLISKESSK